MPGANPLRLYVYIRVTQLPATLEIEFPTEELARRYKSSIEGMQTKALPSSRQKPKIVAVELPRSVIDLETNRGLQGFVLHFDKGEDAAGWVDAVCRPVQGHERQVFVKQYWDGTDELEGKIAAQVATPPRSDRARSPPRHKASPSSWMRRPKFGKD